MDFTEYDTRVGAYAVIVDDQDRVLLAWWNGEGHGTPAWSLPGGGVEFDESIEDAMVREVYEETGFHVRPSRPLTAHSFTESRPHARRPYKSLRIVYAATVVGGSLGTTEVAGSTDYADWVPIESIAEQSRTEIVDIGLAARAVWIG